MGSRGTRDHETSKQALDNFCLLPVETNIGKIWVLALGGHGVTVKHVMFWEP